MACGGCKDQGKQGMNSIDRKGNLVTGEAEMSSAEREIPKPPAESSIFNMTYSEYLKKKSVFKKRSRDAATEAAKSFSKDYKRIQIQQLVDVANFDEVGRISPEQAIVALWEFSHSKEYQEVFDEFKDLRQVIDMRYEQLSKNKISLNWSP